MKTIENQDGWTAERDTCLRQLWDQGLTGSQIAQRMRTTRNSILARARRIRLAARVSEEAKACTRVRRKRNVTAFNFSEARKSGRDPLANLAKEPYASRETVVTPPEKRVPLEALDDSKCKYAHGDAPPYMFCGEKAVMGLAWCEAHARAVFVTPTPAKSSEEIGQLEQPGISRELEAAL